MMFFANHRRRFANARLGVWLVVVCAGLAAIETPANASLIMRDYSETMSAPTILTGDSLSWIDLGAGSSAGVCDDQFFPQPAAPIPAAAILGLNVVGLSNANAGGMCGTSSAGGTPSAASAALGSYFIELPMLVIVRWLHAGQFQWIPFAPRSGLLRPPQLPTQSAAGLTQRTMRSVSVLPITTPAIDIFMI